VNAPPPDWTVPPPEVLVSVMGRGNFWVDALGAAPLGDAPLNESKLLNPAVYDPANNRTNVTTTAPTGGGGMALRQQPAGAKPEPAQTSGAADAAPHN